MSYVYIFFSFFDLFFEDFERVDASFGRYGFFDEIPFSIENPEPEIGRNYNNPQLFASVDLNPVIKKAYLDSLPLLCNKGDDNDYGDTVKRDFMALQAISKRVHHGMWVMELKYQQDRAGYDRLVKAGDKDGIRARLTNANVEEEILDSVKGKAEKAGLGPRFIVEFYKNKIIQITKDVEVMYLFEMKK